jgi:hypothetical protein
MKAPLLLPTAVAWLAGVAPVLAGHTLSPREKTVLDRWLTKNPGWRLATSADCECDGDIASLRAGMGGAWKPVPDYQPYSATGDFNGDGRRDFAVVLRGDSRPWTLVVFNGGSGESTPAYIDSSLDFSGLALSYGPPRPRPYRLVIGPFESHGGTLEPTGRTYRLDWTDY